MGIFDFFRKNKETEEKFSEIKVQGEGLNILYFTKEVEKVNKELFKNAFKFDEINNLIINNHEAIRIVRVPNKKEILLAVNDENGNLSLGITIFSSAKINFTDVTALESKYKFWWERLKKGNIMSFIEKNLENTVNYYNAKKLPNFKVLNDNNKYI